MCMKMIILCWRGQMHFNCSYSRYGWRGFWKCFWWKGNSHRDWFKVLYFGFVCCVTRDCIFRQYCNGIFCSKWFFSIRLPFTPLIIVALDTGKKMRETNQLSQEILTGIIFVKYKFLDLTDALHSLILLLLLLHCYFFYFSIQSLPFGNYCWHFASTNRTSHHSNACPRSPWKYDSYRCAKICGVFASCSEGINLLLVNIKNKLCSR